MNTQALMTFVFACLCSLVYCPTAYADLGNCFVYRGGDSDLEGEFYDKTKQLIYAGHTAWKWSSDDIVIVLDIAGKSKPKGSYEIRPIELVMGDRTLTKHPWTLRGYKITAPDVTGIQNGVAEIVAALKADTFSQLQTGRRNGPVATPRTRDEPPN